MSQWLLSLVSVVYLLMMLAGHTVAGWSFSLAVPISPWREGPYAVFGYAYFGLLFVASLLLQSLLVSGRQTFDIAMSRIIMMLFLVVMVTPSQAFLHRYASLIMFTLLIAYYSSVLYRWHYRWFMLHMCILILLTLATAWHSYGFFQKTLVLYLLVLMNVHGWWLGRGRATLLPSRGSDM